MPFHASPVSVAHVVWNTPTSGRDAFFGSPDPIQPSQVTETAEFGDKNTNYLSNVLQQNFASSAMRQQRVEDDVRRTRKGVQVQQAR